MIIFKSVKWKNLLSSGNNWTSIQLDRSTTTLIVGQNGAGKSTLLDALSFGLFGKPHRNIAKPQLVNSVNRKGCTVEVEFNIGKHVFKIVRGIKPNVFEIWQNGKMINQDSTVKDYQKFLELNILKLNHKSFHQIVVLGSSSFIPFMQLPAGSRRSVIEDILDIGIFSKMNLLLKEKMSKNKENLADVAYNLELVSEKIAMQCKYVDDIAELNAEYIKSRKNKIEDLQKLIEREGETKGDIIKQAADLLASIELTKLSDYENKHSDLIDYRSSFNAKMKELVKNVKFYEENDTCPTCDQSIEEDIKCDHISKAKDKAKTISAAVEKADEEISKVKANISAIQDVQTQVSQLQQQVATHDKMITSYQKQIEDLETEILQGNQQEGDLKEARDLLANLIEDKSILQNRKSELLDERSYTEAAAEMLKDTGIKTKIIKEYLPVINNLVNNYLQVMDFFVSFHLDETFTETIKSRHRDTFSYSSFSEGEKMKIDLSLLFTWRQIARMKNSTNTNLLILDEVLDSSLDSDSLGSLSKIINSTCRDQNVFIISHREDRVESDFRSKIMFKKEGNFSVMETNPS